MSCPYTDCYAHYGKLKMYAFRARVIEKNDHLESY